ncbi:MAG TPA: NAD(P)-dependent oxidoreductase [Acidobacteriaceae bacterium]|nr:NAD(P)-dependent oxidoreductase [Acidobacteriaceae bacterium]
MKTAPPVAAPPIAEQDLRYVLERTEPLWQRLRGRRLFLSGGTGFFGCWLLESLLAANREMNLDAAAVVLTRSPENFRARCPHLAADPAIELVAGDVRDFAFPSGGFAYVIHAATDTVAHDELALFSTIVEGTKRCLELARSGGAAGFLFTSSGAVYGRQPAALSHLPEDYAGAPELLQPGTAYAEGKRAAETLCGLYAASGALECKVARCFAFTGAHLPLDAHFAIGNFLRDAMRGGPILVSGDGTPMRSYLYAADLAVWLWTLLLRAPSGRAYNVGSDHAVSIHALAREVAQALDPAIEVRVARAPVAGAPLSQYVPSIERVRRELGLEVGIGLREAIRRTAAWHGFPLPEVDP